jgi:hypothetical protein
MLSLPSLAQVRNSADSTPPKVGPAPHFELADGLLGPVVGRWLAGSQVQGNQDPVLLAPDFDHRPIQPKDPDLDRCSETVRTSLKAVDLPIPAPNLCGRSPLTWYLSPAPRQWRRFAVPADSGQDGRPEGPIAPGALVADGDHQT